MLRRISMKQVIIKKKVSIVHPHNQIKNKLPLMDKKKRRSTLKKVSMVLTEEQKRLLLNIFYMKLRIVKNSLIKYSYNLNIAYNKFVISNIFNKNSSFHAKYKEMLLLIDESEFIYEYYDLKTSFQKINIFGIISKSLDRFFPSYLGSGFDIYLFMNRYLLKKQNLINKIEKEENLKFNKLKRTERKLNSNNNLLQNFNLINNDESKISESYDEKKTKDMKNKDSTNEIIKLIHKIKVTEKKNKLGKEENKEDESIKKQKTNQKQLKFSNPILSNYYEKEMNDNENIPLSDNNRNNKRLLSSYIRGIQKKKIERFNSQISLSKNELKQVNEFYKIPIEKKKISSLITFVNQRKTIIDDNYTININNKSHSFLNNKTKNKNFKKINEFISNSKKLDTYSEVNKIINDCINNPFKVAEEYKEYQNKKNKKKNISSARSRNFSLYKMQIHNMKSNSNLFLSYDGFSQEIPATPKFIKSKKPKINNLKYNHENIGKQYYYNSLFNSDGFQKLEKTFLKSENYHSYSSHRQKHFSQSPVTLKSSKSKINKSKSKINKNNLNSSNSLGNKHFGRNNIFLIRPFKTNIDILNKKMI